MKLILDSGSNVRRMDEIKNFSVVPLYLCTEEKEYKDDENLDVMGMVSELEHYKGTSHSSCPGIGDFEKELKGEKEAIIVSLASKLSGCFNAACTAAGMHMEENADTTVHVLDCNAIGPTERLVAEKFIECEKRKLTIDETFDTLKDYALNHTRIGFCLKSLTNLANNGRISPVIAKFATVVGIRIVGIFSEWGELQPTSKARGEKKALEGILEDMRKGGYLGGKVIIDHCDGEEFAVTLKNRILELFPKADIKIGTTTGLCSFYAERGGIVLSYEM